MRYAGAILAVAAASVACVVVPSPASGAATRAEYLAQIEPICQAANQRAKKLARKTNRRLKKSLGKAKGKGKVVGDVYILSIIKLVGPENRLFQRTTTLIRAVPPAPGDEAVVSAWLAGRDESTRLASEAIRAGKRGRANQMLGLLDASTVALRRGQQPVQAFGLNHCFVELPVV
jgi:hypothetical protein